MCEEYKRVCYCLSIAVAVCIICMMLDVYLTFKVTVVVKKSKKLIRRNRRRLKMLYLPLIKSTNFVVD